MRSQACMQRGARADAFAEACEPILRLKFKLPVSAPRNGFIIGVFHLMCPPCLHRQSSPPCAQFDHRHLLVRVLRHRCPRAARPCSWSFRPLPCPQSCNFRPLLRKDGRMHCFEKRSVIMSHLKYEIERIRHDPHDELLKSSPFCSEPAAAVSITCQETPNRTASPFDELPPARMRYLAHSKLSEPLLSIPYNSRCSCSVLCSSEQKMFGATKLVRYL